jgi:hypothetical protein
MVGGAYVTGYALSILHVSSAADVAHYDRVVGVNRVGAWCCCLMKRGKNETIQLPACPLAAMSLRIQLKELPMKKVLVLALLVLSPLVTLAADINVNLGGARVTTGANYQYGDRDKRGYYWDGKTWRDPDYWQKNNQGKGQGKGQDCPPGQAKKGNCR